MKKFVPLALFAIAFAMVECAVVIYLRRLFYPEGFSFPIKPMPMDMARVEILREAASLVMLGTVGAAAGKNAWQKFSYFMFLFGVWDVFYYLWLWVLIGWPESLFTPDLLFLIPAMWWGPVLAPVIVALSMCVAALIIVRLDEMNVPLVLEWYEDFFVTIGALIILYSFMADSALLEAGKPPVQFRWGVYWLGEIVGLIAFARFVFRAVRRL